MFVFNVTQRKKSYSFVVIAHTFFSTLPCPIYENNLLRVRGQVISPSVRTLISLHVFLDPCQFPPLGRTLLVTHHHLAEYHTCNEHSIIFAA